MNKVLTKTLPKRIYVAWNGPSHDRWLEADAEWQQFGECEGKRRVGVYERVDVVEVSAPPVSKPLRRPRASSGK